MTHADALLIVDALRLIASAVSTVGLAILLHMIFGH